MESKSKFNKIMDVVAKCITVILFVFTACIMIFTILSVTTIDKNDRNIFGYKFYIVQTDSMSASDKNAHLDPHYSKRSLPTLPKTQPAFNRSPKYPLHWV